MKLLKEIFIAILYLLIAYFGIYKGNINFALYALLFIITLEISNIKDLIKNQNKNH